jgi:hypothetical protein
MPTKRDQKKLLRLLGYLETTKELKYNITPKEPLAVITHVDAAFVMHEDSRSH